MNIIPAPRAPDLSSFSVSPPLVRYGLPSEVKFCRKCVISNQRPNSTVEYEHRVDSNKATIEFFDGVCGPCRLAEQKNASIDWSERERELNDLLNRFRSKDGEYDCIVAGSGGKDSFFTAHTLRHKYGMNPLTVTWSPHIYTDWGRRNFSRWIHSGNDNILVTPNGKVHRLLTRLAVDNLFHPFQPFIFGQKSLPPKMALLHKIPLVFYGENESEYGNPTADAAVPERDDKFFAKNDESEIFLGGVSSVDLKNYFGLTTADLSLYQPADSNALKEQKVQAHYLGYYLKWHPQSFYYYAVEHGGFEPSPERTPGTYSKYSSIDDRVDDFHYYTTGVKFGVGRASYDAAQEIRSGDISREEGVALVARYDHEFPDRFASEIYRYLSIPPSEFPQASLMFEQPLMDEEYFRNLADSFRSPHLWKWEEGKWKLRHAVYHEAIS